MTPILYESTEKQFNSLGIGKLSDATSCIVTEERNGGFELSMQYPVDGILYSELRNDRIVLAKPNETMQDQPFRIFKISIPINGHVTVYGEHISYQLNDIPVFPFTASSAPEAVAGMVSNSVTPNPFTFSTDKTTAGDFQIKTPQKFRTMLHGVEGSLVDVYGGGDYEYDRWNIYLRNRRGQDNGVVIEYGKNLTDLRQETAIDNLVQGIAPFWTDNDGNTVTLPERVIALQNDYSYTRVVPHDLSSEFEEAPTVEQLRTAANAYLNSTDLTTPRVGLTVSFVPLWQTENYKDNPLYGAVSGLERVSLCDTVTVRFIKLGVDAAARVVKTVYDVLKERYNSVEIGEPSSRSSDRAAQQQITLENTPTVSFLEQAILNATNAITGYSGGYVVLDPPKNPQRILIMDKPDKETAVNVWQWNLNGLGFSNSGINGPYRLAMTSNPGAIVADFITAGTLSANIIKAGILQDAAGRNSINMVTGDVSMQGTFRSTSGNVRTDLRGGSLEYYSDNTLRLALRSHNAKFGLLSYDPDGAVMGLVDTQGVWGKQIGVVDASGLSWALFTMGSNGYPNTAANFRIRGYKVRWDSEGYLRQDI